MMPLSAPQLYPDRGAEKSAEPVLSASEAAAFRKRLLLESHAALRRYRYRLLRTNGTQRTGAVQRRMATEFRKVFAPFIVDEIREKDAINFLCLAALDDKDRGELLPLEIRRGELAVLGDFPVILTNHVIERLLQWCRWRPDGKAAMPAAMKRALLDLVHASIKSYGASDRQVNVLIRDGGHFVMKIRNCVHTAVTFIPEHSYFPQTAKAIKRVKRGQ